MNLVELEALIKARRSVRKWKADPVDINLIRKALELACWAPNGGNQQSWMFYVTQNRDIINRIADAVKAKAELIASWPESAKVGPILDRYVQNCDFFRSAPVVVAAMAKNYSSPMDKALFERGEEDAECLSMIKARQNSKSAVQTVSAAVAYLCLIFHQMGLGAVWMSGPLIAKKEIDQLLEIPPEYSLVAMIPTGYPDESPEIKERKPLDEVVKIIE